MLFKSIIRHNIIRHIKFNENFLINHDNQSRHFYNQIENQQMSTIFFHQNFGKFSNNKGTIRLFSTLNDGNSFNNNDLNDFRSISSQNKRLIAKYLGLKSSFINDIGAKISNDNQQIMFNFFSMIDDDHFDSFPLYFEDVNKNFLNNKESRNGIVQDKRNSTEFLFYSFDISEEMRNLDQIFESTDNKLLVIFEDLFDALAFYQQTKLPTIVIRLLNDENVIFKNFCHKLDNHFKKIILWTKHGSKFEKLRKKCIENFNERKIQFINSKSTATQLLAEDPKTKFDSQLLNATPLRHPSILSFNDLKDDVFNEFSDPTIVGVQWSRFPKLNEHLKGHRSGELTIITGPTGCGKTTFVSEYSLDLCMQGVPTLWGSFEIKNIRLMKLMMTQYAQKNLTFTNKNEFDREAESFSKLPLYFMKFHGQTEIDLIMKAAEHAVLTLNIKHIVIDNLQFMLGMNVDSNYDRFLKQDFLISCLRQFSTDYDCHITLVAHPRKEKEEITLSNNSLYGGIKASQEADNVMIIMNKFNARYRCNKYIQITKNRYYGSLGVVPLYFDKVSSCFSSSPSSNATTLSSSLQNSESITSTYDRHQTLNFDNEPIKTDSISDVYRMRCLIENQ